MSRDPAAALPDTCRTAIDHCTAECTGIHTVKKATRFEALEPIRQGVQEYFGGFAAGSAAGLRLRHDHGSVYMSDDFQNEIRFLGLEPSPAFVRQPEGNGCIERFFRTLKEQLLWIRRFRDLTELRAALVEFRQRYNQHWIIQRLNYRTPIQATPLRFTYDTRSTVVDESTPGFGLRLNKHQDPGPIR